MSLKIKPSEAVTDISGYLYDYTDEVEAHLRGSVFGSNMPAIPDPKVYSNLPIEERHVNDGYKYQVKIQKGTRRPLDNEIYK